VIREVGPDAVVVVEGPNRNEELDLFFRTDVGPEWRTFLRFANCCHRRIRNPIYCGLNATVCRPFTHAYASSLRNRRRSWNTWLATPGNNGIESLIRRGTQVPW